MKNNYLRFRFLTALTIFILSSFFLMEASAQVPTTQDCLGAIPVCDYIYVEDSTAGGYGNYFEIPNGGNGCPNNHCMDGEKNSRWYIWTVIESGKLRFQITPGTNSDDYDWAVFDLTNSHCDDIWSGASQIMSSCNAAGGAGYQGTTGISTFAGGNSNCNNGGNTNKWNADLQVYEGETYVLVVSDWTQTPGGYTLDFTSSTAVIFDDEKPYIETVYGNQVTACGTNELTFRFNENVKCSSVSAGDFKLTGPGGPYTMDSIYGENCELGGNNEREYTVYFTPAIYQGGDYALEIKFLSFISDACNNYASPNSTVFQVNLNSPTALAGPDIDIAYATTATLDGDAAGGSGNYSYHWEPEALLDNPNIPNPTTVVLTSSNQFILTVDDENSNCIGQDTMWVNIVGGPLGVSVTASAAEICDGEIVNLNAFPDGGSGSYTFSWTSDPPGFVSNIQNPSDFPNVTTTYKLEISDGFTVLTDEVTVIVNQKPLANAGADQIINEGTSTVLSGSGGGGTGNYSYMWEPASFLVDANVQNPQTVVLYAPTIFTLYVQDENGCISEPDHVLVNTEGPALAAFPIADPLELCAGETVTVTANATGGGGEYSYSWTSNPPGFTSSSQTFTDNPTVSTRYDLILKDQFDNEFSAHVLVTVNPLPVVDLVPDNVVAVGTDSIAVCVRDSVWLDAGYNTDPAGTIYFWDENYEGRYYLSTTNGNWFDIQKHTVQVTHGTTGCKNSGDITIIYDFNQCEIGVPETHLDLYSAIGLHPNPNNGTFTLSMQESIYNLDIRVLDISGRLIYQENWQGHFAPGYSQSIQPENLEKGLYFVYLKSGATEIVKKMVVQ